MISSLAHQNELFPIDITWKEQTKESLEISWTAITDEFDLSGHPEPHRYVNDQLNTIWRRGYSNLKKSLVERYLDCSDIEILSMLPSTVDSTQFQNLLAQWKTEEAKAKSEQNKINPSKQMNHHIGAKSCLQRAYELKDSLRLKLGSVTYKIRIPRTKRLETS